MIIAMLPGDEKEEAADEGGRAAMALLRAMGLPTLHGLVHGSASSLKEKAAAKKRAAALLTQEVRERRA